MEQSIFFMSESQHCEFQGFKQHGHHLVAIFSHAMNAFLDHEGKLVCRASTVTPVENLSIRRQNIIEAGLQPTETDRALSILHNMNL